jgi:predicted enzyme related to lactoylglutathione lyase
MGTREHVGSGTGACPNRTRHQETDHANLNNETGRRIPVKVALTSVFVPDPIKAFKFYTEVLGFVEQLYMPDMQLAIVVSPDEPNGTALLLEPNGNLGADIFHKGVYEAGLPIIVFGTKDIQADYERLKGLGVEFRKEPTRADFGIEAIFDDTCGNLIQLVQS